MTMLFSPELKFCQLCKRHLCLHVGKKSLYVLSVKEGRLKCNQLQNELGRLENEICESGCNVNDVTSISEKKATEISPHM